MENQTAQKKRLLKTVSVGLMAALVFVGNYLQIKIPVSLGDVTRIHLGNSMCLLAGLLFGSTVGGLASGIGAGLFDLLDPVYIVSAPYTFCSKFAMGFLAGQINRSGNQKKGKGKVLTAIAASVVGQLVYIVLYLFKSYLSLILLGSDSKTAFAAVVPKIVTSSVNAVAAIVIAVPLYLALSKALSHTEFYSMIQQKKENKGYLNPVTVSLIAFCCLVTLLFSLYLSNFNKQKAKEQELQSQLSECQDKLDYLAGELNIVFPETETDSQK